MVVYVDTLLVDCFIKYMEINYGSENNLSDIYRVHIISEEIADVTFNIDNALTIKGLEWFYYNATFKHNYMKTIFKHRLLWYIVACKQHHSNRYINKGDTDLNDLLKCLNMCHLCEYAYNNPNMDAWRAYLCNYCISDLRCKCPDSLYNFYSNSKNKQERVDTAIEIAEIPLKSIEKYPELYYN